MDIANYIAKWDIQLEDDEKVTDLVCRDGLIYFSDFCHFVLGKLREEERERGEESRQEMFKVKLCIIFSPELVTPGPVRDRASPDQQEGEEIQTQQQLSQPAGILQDNAKFAGEGSRPRH